MQTVRPAMSAWRERMSGGLGTWLLIAGLVGSAAYGVDRLHQTAASQQADESTSLEAAHGGDTRAFVVLVDSLSYRAAMDAELMPTLALLRPLSAWGEMATVVEGLTAPAVRAAFTGVATPQLLSFLSNLNIMASGYVGDSLFAAAKRSGLRTLVVSDNTFDMFGRDVEARRYRFSVKDFPHSLDVEVPKQLKLAREALAEFERGAYEVAVVHLTVTDHVAHWEHPGGAKYAKVFGAVDDFIGEAANRVPLTSTFVVLGDHGHTDNGRHGPDLDTPTFALYRGAPFKPNFQLGKGSLIDHRYLLGFALGLPLEASYRGRHLSAALVPQSRLPASYEVAATGLAGAKAGPFSWGLLAAVTGGARRCDSRRCKKAAAVGRSWNPARPWRANLGSLASRGRRRIASAPAAHVPDRVGWGHGGCRWGGDC